VVARARATEEHLSATSKDEDKRWLGITGMAATMGNSDASLKHRPMFEALSLAVRGLEDLRRTMPCSQRESEAISEMREALWLRLRCAQMQVCHGMGTVLA
jgi:hypothetical protein